MPKDFLTEDGPWPDLAREYGLKEAASGGYPVPVHGGETPR